MTMGAPITTSWSMVPGMVLAPGSRVGGASVAGASVAGASVAGGSVGGASVAGASVGGASVAGASVAGSSVFSGFGVLVGSGVAVAAALGGGVTIGSVTCGRVAAYATPAMTIRMSATRMPMSTLRIRWS